MTFGELQAAVRSWLNRDDLSDAEVNAFIAIAEPRVRREQKADLRVRTIESGTALTITTQGMALPLGVMDVKDMWPTTGRDLRPLEQTSLATLRSFANDNADATGTPRYFAIVPSVDPATTGARLFLWPMPSVSGYAVDYLYVNDVGTVNPNGNSILTSSPEVYLYATLVEASPFLKADERTALWEMKYATALNGLNKRVATSQFAASRTRPRLRALG